MPERRQQILDAFVKAFPTPNDLSQMFYGYKGEPLSHYVANEPIRDMVYKLVVEVAEPRGWLDDLIAYAATLGRQSILALAGPPPAAPAPASITKGPKRFTIALSFPREYRSRVETIAEALAATLGSRDHILYDKWNAAEFARPNLNIYLPNLYHDECELIVCFHCAAYVEKEWCGLEWRAILDLLKKRDDKRKAASLMFLRFDHAPIPGLFSGDGYLDIRNLPDAEVATEILKRLEINRRNP